MCLAKLGENDEPAGPGLVETPTKIVSGVFDEGECEIRAGTIHYKNADDRVYHGAIRELCPDGEGALISSTQTVIG